MFLPSLVKREVGYDGKKSEKKRVAIGFPFVSCECTCPVREFGHTELTCIRVG